MSPESLKFAKEIKAIDDAYKLIATKYNDLWALGIIFLELVLLDNVHEGIYNIKEQEINF